MKLQVENVKNFTVANDEIIDKLKLELPADDGDVSIEEFEFDFKGINYALIILGEDNWISEGKYEYNNYKYQLVSYDKNITSYPCAASITNYYNIILDQGVSRSGSYYTEWYYMYNNTTIMRVNVEVVPEVIIPEHENVRYEIL